MNEFEPRFLNSEYIELWHNHLDGQRYVFNTKGDYQLSVVRFQCSMGYVEGLYELAIIDGFDVFDEPEGYLSVDEVLSIVEEYNKEDE